ncbi:hypothetical protein NLG97_g7144 [Lecanicillium saksenae]|uniref:Uncharacterized protein n=1 Tax=Lecanicillium saksenae TaxID=468837 RepID=A0ACC1QQM4_9HYPO|nr:hypothetical protein NLG97_g7144 [Lecanicillium saksenae]
MKVLALLAGIAVAGAYELCPGGLISNPSCCAASFFGFFNINCNVPSVYPSSGAEFQQACASEGLSAKCCAFPIAGQAFLCNTPVGVQS